VRGEVALQHPLHSLADPCTHTDTAQLLKRNVPAAELNLHGVCRASCRKGYVEADLGFRCTRNVIGASMSSCAASCAGSTPTHPFTTWLFLRVALSSTLP
jgi:hypothetical protein